MSSVPGSGEQRYTITDVIAGLLAAASLLLSFIAIGFGLILQVEPRPARLTPDPRHHEHRLDHRS